MTSADSIQRAGKARHEDRLHNQDCPPKPPKPRTTAWDHVGKDMQRTAQPVRLQPRRTSTPENRLSPLKSWIQALMRKSP